jgi:hypothetical protein
MKNSGIEKDIEEFIAGHLDQSRKLQKWSLYHSRIKEALTAGPQALKACKATQMLGFANLLICYQIPSVVAQTCLTGTCCFASTLPAPCPAVANAAVPHHGQNLYHIC